MNSRYFRILATMLLATVGFAGGCSIECNIGLGDHGSIDLPGIEGVYELAFGDESEAIRLVPVADQGERSFYGMYWGFVIRDGEIQRDQRFLVSLHRIDAGYFIADIRPVMPGGGYGRHQFARIETRGTPIEAIDARMLEGPWVQRQVQGIEGARIATPPRTDEEASSEEPYLHVSRRAALVELLKAGEDDPDAFSDSVTLRKTDFNTVVRRQRAAKQSDKSVVQEAERLVAQMRSVGVLDPADAWSGLKRVKLSFREIHIKTGELFTHGARDRGVPITSGPRYDEVVRLLNAENIRVDPTADVELRLRWIVETNVFTVARKEETFLTSAGAILVDVMADGLVIRDKEFVRVRASIHDTLVTTGICEGPDRKLSSKDLDDDFRASLRVAFESLNNYEMSLSTLEASAKIWREGQQAAISQLKQQDEAGWAAKFMQQVRGPVAEKPLSNIQRVVRINAMVGTNDWASNAVAKRLKLTEVLENRWRRSYRVSSSARPAVSVYHQSYRSFIDTGRTDLAWEPKSDLSYARLYERGALVWFGGRPYAAVIGHEPIVEIDLGINSLTKRYAERDAMNERVIAAVKKQAR